MFQGKWIELCTSKVPNLFELERRSNTYSEPEDKAAVVADTSGEE